MKQTLCGIVLLVLAGGTANAAQVVLDFGTGGILQPPTFSPAYAEDGFRFSTINQPFPAVVDQDHFDIYNAIAAGAVGPDGEREGLIHTGNDADEVIVDSNGAAFDLLSIEVEQIDDPLNGAWEIVASNGSQVTFTAGGTVNFDSAWLNITSFTMRSTSVPDNADFSGFLVFDNITLDTVPTVVPAPAAGWLLGTALAGLCSRRWLRRKISS